MREEYSTGITPETTAAYIEAIASDKASRLKILARATVVMCVTPEWMRAEEVNAVFGIPLNQLVNLAIKGKITARKLDPMLRSSAVIYEAESIRRAIGALTPYEEWARTRPDLEEEDGKEDAQ